MNEQERHYSEKQAAWKNRRKIANQDMTPPDEVNFKDGFDYGWQAHVEIAKQNEKELIEALIQLCSDKHSLELSIGIAIDIIEKHTGKTWEELNG